MQSLAPSQFTPRTMLHTQSIHAVTNTQSIHTKDNVTHPVNSSCHTQLIHTKDTITPSKFMLSFTPRVNSHQSHYQTQSIHMLSLAPSQYTPRTLSHSVNSCCRSHPVNSHQGHYQLHPVNSIKLLQGHYQYITPSRLMLSFTSSYFTPSPRTHN
jgi:hypothetical protein